MKTIKTLNQKKLYSLHAHAFDLWQKIEAAAKREKARHQRQIGGYEKK